MYCLELKIALFAGASLSCTKMAAKRAATALVAFAHSDFH